MRKLFLFLALLFVITGNLPAQVTSITGRVYDVSDNEPLIGATVRIDGTSKITVTDTDGRFALSGLPATAKNLTVTFVGYKTVTLPIARNMNIPMEIHAEMKDEVIVVAFGKQKRESFTGAATVVSASDIERQQVTTPLEALNGRVAGMQMTETNSLAPGTNPSIVIRGIGSLNAGTAPLVILDGLPFAGYYSDINPADIENITVLKDAASNALYGARGANGVIMITTKDAVRGSTKITLNAKWGANHDARVEYDYIDNPGEYYEAHYTALTNFYRFKQGMSAEQAHVQANTTLGLPSAQGGLGYMVYNVPKNQYLIGSNGRLNPNAVLGNRIAYGNNIYTLYPDDWVKEGTRTGFRQEYNLNISGGNERYTFIGSIGYLSNDGVSYGSDIERTTARLKTTYTPYSFLRVGASASYSHSESNDLGYVFATLYDVAPIYPLYIRDANGNIMHDNHGRMFDYGYGELGLDRPVENGGNPIQSDLLDVNTNSVNAFSLQGYATVDFLKDFHFTANGSVYITENRTNSTVNPYYGFTKNTGGWTSVGHARTTETNWQQLLNYNHSFGDHNIDLLLGHEYTRNTVDYLYGDATRIANYTDNKELSGAIINGSNSSYTSLYNVEGFFFRGQYDYASRYFGNFSFRRDGSSNFHPDHRWGNFWSIGGAWILTKEEWFPTTDIVNMLKFKISYGQQGNDKIGSYRYVDLYKIKNSNDEVSFVFSSKGNPNITWEKVGNFNTGLEFTLFNSRLTGGLDYYYRKTSDMLMWFSAPYEMGYNGYYDNVGDMTNQGIELDLNGDIIATRNFTWSLGLNLTWERNRVTSIPEEKRSVEINGHKGYINGDNFVGEGLPVYSWYVKKYAGVGSEGQPLYYKKADDGVITTTDRYDDADYMLCGTALPDLFGGFNTSIKLFGFDVSAQFNYSIGGKKMDSGYQWLMKAPYAGSTGKGLHRDVFASWTPENTGSNMPMWYYSDNNSAPYSSQWLTNASYLTFRNLTVGYTLPLSLTRKLRLSKLRVYGTCENVAYWTKRKGFDPRVSMEEGSFGAYSPMRTISGGISVEF